MTLEDFKFRLSVVFMTGLFIMLISYLIYENYTKSQSEIRYTVCEIKEVYVSSKDIGKKYLYSFKGKRYESTCTSQDCVRAQIGDRFLMKLWVNRPEWNQIFFDKPVVKGVKPPADGWKQAPKDCCSQ